VRRSYARSFGRARGAPYRARRLAPLAATGAILLALSVDIRLHPRVIVFGLTLALLLLAYAWAWRVPGFRRHYVALAALPAGLALLPLVSPVAARALGFTLPAGNPRWAIVAGVVAVGIGLGDHVALRRALPVPARGRAG